MLGALIVSGMAGFGVMANEGTHGGMAEAMGLGHHHMTDVGGYHCASHSGPDAQRHMDHMHNETMVHHENCSGGSSMHRMGMMGGMPSG
jgi:hypothetical protein